jgi:glycosyltransferase involved in cell wall biosynthesis
MRQATARPDPDGPWPSRNRSVTVDVGIPVYNEARALPGCVSVLRAYLGEHCPFEWTITVVANGSTDDTPSVAAELVRSDPRVWALHMPGKGHRK